MPNLPLFTRHLSTLGLVLVLGAAVLGGCSNVERAKPRPQPARADRSFLIDVPPVMRGTVSSETIIQGYQPVVVRGYGIVVGLNGTGSRDMPPALRAHMLAELARHGIGSEREGLGHLSPEAVLNSLDTAVVIVEGVVPSGAVKDTRFDVRVYADPRTGTTSLDGGRLYTADLRPALPGQPLPPTGDRQSFAIAVGGGPVFVNPFADPGAVGRDTVNRNSGRILNGGRVTRSMTIKLALAMPGHARAAAIQDAINARFPQEAGQMSPTARGESDESIEITVPRSWHGRTDEFVALLQHTTIRISQPESIAMSVRRAMLANPAYARSASWRWQALGVRVLPIIRDLYDYPEELPRLSALRAGAKLDDALVVPHLIEMARTGGDDNRLESIRLLQDMQSNPVIDQALRELLSDPAVDVRLTAYEALVERGDPYMDRLYVDEKFVVDLVESDHPLIYISQSARPRIVLFGKDLEIVRPTFVQAWANRFMIQAEDGEEEVEVYYRPVGADRGAINKVKADVADFLYFLGHRTTIEQPEAGLGLSYGEAVGLLHQIWRQKYIAADFKAEQDRILAAIMREGEGTEVEDRPEFSSPDASPSDDQNGGDSMSDLDRISSDAALLGAQVPRGASDDN